MVFVSSKKTCETYMHQDYSSLMHVSMWILHSPPDWHKEFWETKGLSVRIPTLSLAFSVWVSHLKKSIFLPFVMSEWCLNDHDVGKKCFCQSPLYGQAYPCRMPGKCRIHFDNVHYILNEILKLLCRNVFFSVNLILRLYMAECLALNHHYINCWALSIFNRLYLH